MRTVVGALIRDSRNRVYVHRRSPTRRLLPGVWDVVGGHVEADETPEQALAREIEEETGWRLRRIETVLAEWDWIDPGGDGGGARHELDYLVEVDGDLSAPRLEQGKHDAYAWVDQQSLDLLMEGRRDDDRRLRDVVAKAVRTRVTERLLLVPIGPEHASDFWRVQQDAASAPSSSGPTTSEWPLSLVEQRVREWSDAWEERGAHRWMAYRRDTGDLVGCGGPGHRLLDGVERLEVGWSVLAPHRGQGLAVELGTAALRFARETLGARTVVAVTEADNDRSLSVMKRLGMREVATYSDGDTPMVLYESPT